jgi:hypothetical protein
VPYDPTGIGTLTAIPAASTNGTPLTLPAGTTAVRLYLNPGDSVTYTVTQLQPATAPAATWTITATAPITFDEPLAAGQQLFVTAASGTPAYRVL